MTPLLKRLEGISAHASSLDGKLRGEINFVREVKLSWADPGAYHDYNATTLADQLTELLRALDAGHRGDVRRAFELEGRVDELVDEPHWEANHRRFDEQLAKSTIIAKSPRGAVKIAASGTLDNFRVKIHPRAISELDAGMLLAEVSSAYVNLGMKFRSTRYGLVKKHLPF